MTNNTDNASAAFASAMRDKTPSAARESVVSAIPPPSQAGITLTHVGCPLPTPSSPTRSDNSDAVAWLATQIQEATRRFQDSDDGQVAFLRIEPGGRDGSSRNFVNALNILNDQMSRPGSAGCFQGLKTSRVELATEEFPESMAQLTRFLGECGMEYEDAVLTADCDIMNSMQQAANNLKRIIDNPQERTFRSLNFKTPRINFEEDSVSGPIIFDTGKKENAKQAVEGFRKNAASLPEWRFVIQEMTDVSGPDDFDYLEEALARLGVPRTTVVVPSHYTVAGSQQTMELGPLDLQKRIARHMGLDAEDEGALSSMSIQVVRCDFGRDGCESGSAEE